MRLRAANNLKAVPNYLKLNIEGPTRGRLGTTITRLVLSPEDISHINRLKESLRNQRIGVAVKPVLAAVISKKAEILGRKKENPFGWDEELREVEIKNGIIQHIVETWKGIGMYIGGVVGLMGGMAAVGAKVGGWLWANVNGVSDTVALIMWGAAPFAGLTLGFGMAVPYAKWLGRRFGAQAKKIYAAIEKDDAYGHIRELTDRAAQEIVDYKGNARDGARAASK